MLEKWYAHYVYGSDFVNYVFMCILDAILLPVWIITAFLGIPFTISPDLS